ncbi:MAG: pyrroline-5-carboxylate reductase [Betaproteobacteria bacterium]
MRIAFVGGGTMASALFGGLIETSGDQAVSVSVIEPVAAQRETLAGRYRIACHAAPDATALDADVIVLAVKPQQMREAAKACAPFANDKLVISVAAGIRITDLQRWLEGHARIIRAMPNTPALIGMGITGLCAAEGAGESDRTAADKILRAVGETVWVASEDLIDAVTAVSGSGPAYVFRFIEAIEQAAIAVGLPPADARRLTIATFVGASQLAARSSEPPAVLRERVTSKGGTTAAALSTMEAAGLGDTLGLAVRAACERSRELGKSFS